MGDIDDPANPYYDQYSTGDHWIWEHKFRVKSTNLVTWLAQFDEQNRQPETFVRAFVDDEGWLIPQAVYFEEQMQAYQGLLAEDEGSAVNHDCPFMFNALGVLDQATSESMRLDKLEVLARYLPSVPVWLANAPPDWAVVLPDGRVVTQGVPGYGLTRISDDPGWCSAHPGVPFNLYQADGKLVQQGAPPGNWWEVLFTPEVPVPEVSPDRQVSVVEVNGCVVYRDMLTDEITASFNYDGAAIDSSKVLRRADGFLVTGLTGADIPIVYALQQEAE